MSTLSPGAQPIDPDSNVRPDNHFEPLGKHMSLSSENRSKTGQRCAVAGGAAASHLSPKNVTEFKGSFRQV